MSGHFRGHLPSSHNFVCLSAFMKPLSKKSYAGEIVGHNSRDATAINACEKPLKKTHVEKIAAKRGRPKQGEERINPLTRIEKQAGGMSLTDMLADLPTACDVGYPRKIPRAVKKAG